jgi:hypothetical protein
MAMKYYVGCSVHHAHKEVEESRFDCAELRISR